MDRDFLVVGELSDAWERLESTPTEAENYRYRQGYFDGLAFCHSAYKQYSEDYPFEEIVEQARYNICAAAWENKDIADYWRGFAGGFVYVKSIYNL